MPNELKTYVITEYISGSRSYEVKAESSKEAYNLFKDSVDQEVYLVDEDLEVDNIFIDGD